MGHWGHCGEGHRGVVCLALERLPSMWMPEAQSPAPQAAVTFRNKQSQQSDEGSPLTVARTVFEFHESDLFPAQGGGWQ